MILAIAGGVGGARLAHGLAQVLGADELTIVVNTGDDFVHLGLHVSPDLDTVMYTLANLNDEQRGWGQRDETWNFMQHLERLGGETWFQLGDRDLATNVERTQRLQRKDSLSEVTTYLCQRLGIAHCIAPMSDDPVSTCLHTNEGTLEFQDYFVRRQAEPVISGFEFAGAHHAQMSPGFAHCLKHPGLRAIVICPSNPYLSIAPILSVPGVRNAIANARVPRLAVSPIIGGKALKGPAAKIMRELGKQSSVVGIADYYQGLVDGLVIDHADASLSEDIARLGITPLVTSTVMVDSTSRRMLAEDVIEFAAGLIRPQARSKHA